MADWLKRVVDETDREFEELPEWKKTADQSICSNEDQPSSTIREPNTHTK